MQYKMRKLWSYFTFLYFLLISQSLSITVPEFPGSISPHQNSSYDPNTRPNNGGVADVINVSLEILAIREVDEDLQNIGMECVLYAFWEDNRLVNFVERETVFADKLPVIWTPHLSITNSIETPSRTGKTLLLKPGGTVDYSERISAKISCQMSMIRYPFGRQHCKVQFASYGYSSLHLILLWNGIISPNIDIFDPEYSLHYIEQSSERQKSSAGEFSYLNVEISLTRSPFRIISRALLPTFLLAVLSYFITFFMNAKNSKKFAKEASKEQLESNQQPEQVEQLHTTSTPFSFTSYIAFDVIRVVVNFFIILIVVLIKQLSFLNAPRSRGPTALDVWMGFVSLNIFVCLMLVLYICFRKWKWHHQEKMCGEISGGCDYDNSRKLFNILRISIPVVFLVFLVAFIGFCLS